MTEAIDPGEVRFLKVAVITRPVGDQLLDPSCPQWMIVWSLALQVPECLIYPGRQIRHVGTVEDQLAWCIETQVALTSIQSTQTTRCLAGRCFTVSPHVGPAHWRQ